MTIIQPSSNDVDILIDMLEAPQIHYRVEAAQTLGRLGADAKKAVPALIRVVESDPDTNARVCAIQALGLIGAKASKVAAPCLIQALQDASAHIRNEAAIALGRIGPVGKEVVNAITKAMLDADPLVRQTASRILNRWR